jgi:hypothetical protein
MTVRNLYPIIKPTILWDFARSRVINPGLSFTRATLGTYQDATGVWREASVNQPRLSFNPTTGACAGVIMESQRVNGIRNPRAEGGAVATNWSLTASANGVTITDIGTVVLNGVSCRAATVVGTCTSSFNISFIADTGSVSAALTGQLWTHSAHMLKQINSGANPNISLRILERSSAGAQLVAQGGTVQSVTNSLSRFSQTFTVTNSATAFVVPLVTLGAITGQTYNLVWYYGWPQLEQGAFVTTPILPPVGSPAQSTRAADSLTLTPSTTDVNTGTWMVSGSTVASGAQPMLSVDDGTVNNQIAIYTSGTDPKLTVTASSITQVDLDGGTVVSLTPFAGVVAYAVNNVAVSVNGGTAQTDTSVTLPTTTRILVGADSTGNTLTGVVRRLAYYNQTLSTSQTQALSKL